MTVNSREQAWKEADKIFPTDYMKDEQSSANAGYPIYESTADNNRSWISDLGNRLELNIWEGETIKSTNIWIEEGEEGEDIEVTITNEVGETRTWNTYKEFRNEQRFWFSGGRRYNRNEDHYEAMIKALRETGCETMTTRRNGLPTTFRLKK